MTSSEENPTLQLFDSCVHCNTFLLACYLLEIYSQSGHRGIIEKFRNIL